MASKAVREAERRSQLEKVPALQEWDVRTNEGNIILRRVESQPPPERKLAETDGTTSQPSRDEAFAPPTDDRPHKSLTLFIAVFDQEITEIRSIHGNEGQSLTTLSNMDWSWFPGISTIESDSTVYTVLAFVEHITREAADERPRPDPAIFSTTTPEYVIYSETDAPPGAIEAIDALHRHYLENKIRLKEEARRSEALRSARERYLQEHPSSPRETTVNFWPVRSRINK